MSEVGTVMCAICGKPVDEVVISRNEFHMGTEIRARCHGAEDVMTVSDHDVHDKVGTEAFRRAVARGGVAFRAQLVGQTRMIEADDV